MSTNVNSLKETSAPAQAARSLPPTPGSQADGEPVITAAQKKRRAQANAREALTPGKIAAYVGMVAVIALFLVPLYFILITSLKERPDIYSDPISWFPNPLHPQNYTHVFESLNFGTYLRNSLIITISLTIIEVVLGVLTAYGFAFLRFPGRNILFLIVVGSLMVPSQITIISNYALVAQMGWRNTFIGIVVPLAAVAFGAFLMRNHFLSLPKEIMEAAEMDAAGFFRTLFKVVLPMSWPTLSAFVLITVVTEWNQYLWPFLISDTDDTMPLPIGLTQLQITDGLTNWGPVMAGTVITTIPMLIVFLVLQKQMIKGLTAGAVKG